MANYPSLKVLVTKIKSPVKGRVADTSGQRPLGLHLHFKQKLPGKSI